MDRVRSSDLLVAASHDLPAEVAEEFWDRSSRATPQSGLIPPEFDALYRVSYGDETAYVAHHLKTNRDGNIESATYIAEANADDSLVGVGEVRQFVVNPSPYHAGKPFVAWTETYEGSRSNGRAKRRLTTMNAASLLLHGLPLHSATLVSDPDAHCAWDRLVAEGLAVSYIEHHVPEAEGRTRYMFLPE